MRPQLCASSGKTCVLAAVSRARERLSSILAGDDVVWADTMQELLTALDRGAFDIVIIGASFDESKALEAVRHSVTCIDRGAVVCVRTTCLEQIGEASFDALVTACNELGVDCVLDLPAFPDDDAGNTCVRQMLQRLVAVP